MFYFNFSTTKKIYRPCLRLVGSKFVFVKKVIFFCDILREKQNWKNLFLKKKIDKKILSMDPASSLRLVGSNIFFVKKIYFLWFFKKKKIKQFKKFKKFLSVKEKINSKIKVGVHFCCIFFYPWHLFLQFCKKLKKLIFYGWNDGSIW